MGKLDYRVITIIVQGDTMQFSKFLGLNFFTLIILLVTGAVQAEIVKLTCPAATNLTFVPLFTNDETYRVTGLVDVRSGNTPTFLLAGITHFQQALYQSRVTYVRDHLTCYYKGAANANFSDEIAITNPSFDPTLEWCYFAGAAQQECQGDTTACVLICEIL